MAESLPRKKQEKTSLASCWEGGHNKQHSICLFKVFLANKNNESKKTRLKKHQEVLQTQRKRDHAQQKEMRIIGAFRPLSRAFISQTKKQFEQ